MSSFLIPVAIEAGGAPLFLFLAEQRHARACEMVILERQARSKHEDRPISQHSQDELDK